MADRPNVLVVCGRNKRRSRTAEYIFKNDRRFNIKSLGLSAKSERQIKEKDVLWADLILVMEDGHKTRIAADYRSIEIPPIEVLQIEDEYEYQNQELIELLTDKINASVNVTFQL
ncbi:protein-tyrosine-phosphatase [Rufibacter glacialis]|uniref:Protein-tyrosine-phosphatase n=1 Tax=Rufibacter glacialis TaxID=1259555 RepID=A0A5M8Q9U3_9BACT|nr:protein-tyrosine-phosphatase [Rufibacter glacialis]KAA6431714.1 protein-tyrosine-phosphatase [Rufibacter glacialis]GGK82212.1 hypothetical protein GCM10011405_32450 [Rufibacter glacialis]